MTDVSTHRIGEEAFCINSRGEIARTVIKSLSTKRFELLSGYNQDCVFELDEAITIADRRIEELLKGVDVALSLNERAKLWKMRRRLHTKLFKKEVLSRDLVVGRTLFGPVPNEAERIGRTLEFPQEYFLPGQTIYGVVTPRTHYGVSPGWHPHPYFILVTTLESVAYAPAWKDNLYYRLKDTNFNIQPENLFGELDEAQAALVEIFARETLGTIESDKIRILEVAEEIEANRISLEAIVKRHTRQRESLAGD